MVLGNCQAWGLAACLGARRPDWQVESRFVGDLASEQAVSDLADQLPSYDLVVAQSLTKARYAPLRLKRLARGVRRLASFPRVVWTGLHPDMIKIGMADGTLAPSPTGNLSSKIASAAFVMGLSPSRACDLFNAYVFARLGYFDEVAKAERFQLDLGAEAGLDLAPVIARWRRLGVFMHHPMHPKIAVSDTLAVEALNALGEDQGAVDNLPPDPLSSDNVWPVLPPLALRLGVDGGVTYRSRTGDSYDLQAFVAASYRMHAEIGAERLADSNLAGVIDILKAEMV